METELRDLILSISFGLWAGVVGYIGHSILKSIESATADLKSLDDDLRKFVNATERRLTRLETKQEDIERTMNDETR